MEESETFEVYITKYALTRGIFRKTVTATEWENSVSVYHPNGIFDSLYQKPDWHRTEAEAADRFETMKKRKLASLEVQRKKIEAMEFRVSER